MFPFNDSNVIFFGKKSSYELSLDYILISENVVDIKNII